MMKVTNDRGSGTVRVLMVNDYAGNVIVDCVVVSGRFSTNSAAGDRVEKDFVCFASEDFK